MDFFGLLETIILSNRAKTAMKYLYFVKESL